MKVYETTFIINPQADDATIDRQVKAVTDLVSDNSGKIVREDRLGTRRLAYDIRGLSQGYYASVIFEAPPNVPTILARHFRLEEPYLRYLTVLFEGDLEAARARQETPGVTTTSQPVAPEAEARTKPEEKTDSTTTGETEAPEPKVDSVEPSREVEKVAEEVTKPEIAQEPVSDKTPSEAPEEENEEL